MRFSTLRLWAWLILLLSLALAVSTGPSEAMFVTSATASIRVTTGHWDATNAQPENVVQIAP